MHIFYSNIRILFLLFQVLIPVLWFPGHSEGLACQTCEDCKDDTNEKVECIAPTEYKHEPDGGQMGCSWETVDNPFKAPDKVHSEDDKKLRIRKRCVFLRNDPDSSKVKTETHCYPSISEILNSKDEDCYCFSDDCNKTKPKPSQSKAATLGVFGVCTMIGVGLFSAFI